MFLIAPLVLSCGGYYNSGSSQANPTLVLWFFHRPLGANALKRIYLITCLEEFLDVNVTKSRNLYTFNATVFFPVIMHFLDFKNSFVSLSWVLSLFQTMQEIRLYRASSRSCKRLHEPCSKSGWWLYCAKTSNHFAMGTSLTKLLSFSPEIRHW